MFLLKLNLGAAYFKITRSQALSRTKWRLSQRCPGQSGDYLSTVQDKVEIFSALSRTKWRLSQHCSGQRGDYLSTVQDKVEIFSALSRTERIFFLKVQKEERRKIRGLFITKKTITAKSRRVSNVFDKQQTICWRDKTGNRNSFPFSPILSLTTGKILTAICAMALHARYIRQTFLLETLGGQQLQCQVGQKCTRWRAEGCFMRGFIRSSGLTLQVSTLCMERDGTREL